MFSTFGSENDFPALYFIKNKELNKINKLFL